MLGADSGPAAAIELARMRYKRKTREVRLFMASVGLVIAGIAASIIMQLF
jgi:hypothetical protein